MKATSMPIPPKWSWHHDALIKIRENLVREHHERSAASRAPTERGGADLADVANDECEHGELLAQISQEQAELVEVDGALARIQDGTYGICELSGAPIGAERLRAIPWTRFSQAAAAGRERAGKAG
jgi:RNA polymerase-binding transcription factor DksA